MHLLPQTGVRKVSPQSEAIIIIIIIIAGHVPDSILASEFRLQQFHDPHRHLEKHILLVLDI